jgi:hypothetical protein
MAITVNTQLTDQVASATSSYCYLYEPLRIDISETDTTATKIYIKLTITELEDTNTIIFEEEAYGEYDLNQTSGLSVDLMKLAQQYHNANVYKFSDPKQLSTLEEGWKSVVSEYRYEFTISSDVSTADLSVIKIPIIGARRFVELEAIDFTADSPTNEYEKYGLDLSTRWGGYSIPNITMADPTDVDARPEILISVIPVTTTPAPCAGMLYWKSRLGGWMYWGFDLKKKTQSKKYTGNIPVGLYEAQYGNPFVEANYTGIETSYKIVLKALSLTSVELEAMQDITSSPAVYYQENISSRMELMRLTSATAPIDNKANGGDFSVSLSSIYNSSQMTR